LVVPPAALLAGVTLGAIMAAAAWVAGCGCTGWLCCWGAAGCGKYFLSNGWNANITINVSRKTSISRFSLPGSCCGF
jgi:hypothetical protein